MRTTIVLAILLTAATARADGSAGVVVTGEATLQPQLVAQLEGWLRQHGHALVPSPLEPDAINTLIDCFVIEDESCARGVVDKRAKSTSILFAHIEATPNEMEGLRDVTLIAYWFQKGHAAVTERRLCERCTEQTLRSATDDLMAALTAVERSHHGADPSPPAAETRVLVEPARPSRLLPGALIAGGAALAIGGGVLFALDEHPNPNGPQKPQYLDTTPGGVALVSVGVTAAAVGVYLWLHAGTRSTPIAAATRDGGFVGWAGRF